MAEEPRPDPHCEVILVRHAQSEWNASGLWQGQADPALSAQGRAQVAALAEALERELAGDPVNALICSDLSRTRETAQGLEGFLGLTARPDPGLRELDVGEWSGLNREQIVQRDPELLARFEAANHPYQEYSAEMTGSVRLAIARDPSGNAIEIVERALQKYGAPVYVRHEIVHNRYVVDSLKAKGAIFVEELDEVPDDAPVVFRAHGVPKAIPAEAARRKMLYVDATCPLVSKVHRQAERQIEKGQHILFIGHAGHPEVIGTMGQVPEGRITLVETIDDVAELDFGPDDDLSYLSQTTLSVDDTRDIIAALEARFPQIVAPKAEDICYATSNRQAAVKQIAASCDLVLVIGAPNSSNSLRLVEVAERLGTTAYLIQRADEMDPAWLEGIGTIGLTAGASAPEKLVREVVDRLSDWRLVEEEVIAATEENMIFKLPRQLTD